MFLCRVYQYHFKLAAAIIKSDASNVNDKYIPIFKGEVHDLFLIFERIRGVNPVEGRFYCNSGRNEHTFWDAATFWHTGQESHPKKSEILSEVVSLERLELSTHCLEGSCSIHLSYRDGTNAR